MINIDAFQGLYRDYQDQVKPQELPFIHCHLFSREEDAIRQVEHHLGFSLGQDLIHVQHVRSVAPNKDMMCVSFRLPSDCAFSSTLKRKAST